jgi:ATP-dependent Lon protease
VPEQLDTKILPLLPLSTGVVLPGMVVTLTLETPDARAAVHAARGAEDTLLLVPRRENGSYARVGTVAHIEEIGRTPGGTEAVVIRGMHRATVGSGVAGAGDAVWVRYEDRHDPLQVSERAHDLGRQYRATVENILDARGASQIAEFLRGIDEPGALADMAGYSPDLSLEQRIELLETLDVEQRLEKVVAWA